MGFFLCGQKKSRRQIRQIISDTNIVLDRIYFSYPLTDFYIIYWSAGEWQSLQIYPRCLGPWTNGGEWNLVDWGKKWHDSSILSMENGGFMLSVCGFGASKWLIFFRVWSIPTVSVKCVFEIKCYNYNSNSIQFLRKNIYAFSRAMLRNGLQMHGNMVSTRRVVF